MYEHHVVTTQFFLSFFFATAEMSELRGDSSIFFDTHHSFGDFFFFYFISMFSCSACDSVLMREIFFVRYGCFLVKGA